tara:strand:+ start:86 stop:952 length:867 start_codon:yes stop_codon:yes gene_type:complete
MKKLNVLSLFNGMSVGMMALEDQAIEVGSYYSSEIDRYANQATQALYPEIIQVGDVTRWREWDIDWSSIDLLLAGFPCQAWSMAGKQQGDNDPRGALVHDLIDIWNHIKSVNPELKFMFENVKMKKEFLDYINDLFGVNPVCINSALVSAQNRVRYYWTNIGTPTQPANLNINLIDILDNPKKISPGIEYKKKSKTIRCGGALSRLGDRHEWDSPLKITDKSLLSNKQFNFYNTFRFSAIEMGALQNIDKIKTSKILSSGIPQGQAKKMIGNSWTMKVISHLFKGLSK